MIKVSKKMVIGLTVIAIALLVMASTVYGATTVQTIKAYLGVKIFYEGRELTGSDRPYLINNRTYIPLRMLIESFDDKEIRWDPVRYHVNVTDKTSRNEEVLRQQLRQKDDEIARLTKKINRLEDELDDYQSTSISRIRSVLTSNFRSAGDKYFNDDGIDVIISLSGNEDELVYTIKLDFDDARYYDNLTEISRNRLTTFLNAVKSRINSEIDNTYYEDADITGKLIDNDISRYYVSYNGRSYYFSWDSDNDISLSSIKSRLQSYFRDAGNKYFVDDGIDVIIGLSGNKNELVYTIKLDFDDARYYDDLTEINRNRLTTFLNAVKSRINTEIDNTYYEGAGITGKLIDNDMSRYYVSYNGRSYAFSWN